MLYTELDIADMLDDEVAKTENKLLDRMDHLRDRFRRVIQSVRDKQEVWDDSSELVLLRRLEVEIRKAYAPTWEQSGFDSEEVEHVLRQLDVERA